jgi:hypothetical protein
MKNKDVSTVIGQAIERVEEGRVIVLVLATR